MSNDAGMLLDLYIPWEASLDQVTEEQFPPWYLLAKDAFEKGDDEDRVWMMEVMYESHPKFYSESVHIVDKSCHYYVTCVFVPENWYVEGQHMTSPIMSTACWNELNSSQKPYWVSENSINHVSADIFAYLKENRTLQLRIIAWCDDILPEVPLEEQCTTPDNSEMNADMVELAQRCPVKPRCSK